MVATGPEPPSSRLRRLHTLTGVGPLGLFLLVHLGSTHRAVAGPEAFARGRAWIADAHSLHALGSALVLGLLAFHAGYGLVRLVRTPSPSLRLAPPADWYRATHRAAGLVTLGFVGVHLVQLRLPLLRGALSPEGLYPALEAVLGTPGGYALHLVGLSAVVYHFAYGLWQAGNTWGVTTRPEARRQSAFVCAALGLALWALGADTLIHFFARCGGVLPGASQRAVGACRGADLSRLPRVPTAQTGTPA